MPGELGTLVVIEPCRGPVATVAMIKTARQAPRKSLKMSLFIAHTLRSGDVNLLHSVLAAPLSFHKRKRLPYRDGTVLDQSTISSQGQ